MSNTPLAVKMEGLEHFSHEHLLILFKYKNSPADAICYVQPAFLVCGESAMLKVKVATIWYVTDACNLFNRHLILSMDVSIATSSSTVFARRSYQGSFNMHYIYNTSSLDVIKLASRVLSSVAVSVEPYATECSAVVIHVQFTLILCALQCLVT